jgi:hypothetical protein
MAEDSKTVLIEQLNSYRRRLKIEIDEKSPRLVETIQIIQNLINICEKSGYSC